METIFRELEYDILSTSQKIESEIFNKLMYVDNYELTKDEIGREFDGRENFYKSFHIKMVS
jgi:hypothetical protein